MTRNKKNRKSFSFTMKVEADISFEIDAINSEEAIKIAKAFTWDDLIEPGKDCRVEDAGVLGISLMSAENPF